jgi:hypothetical protein
MRSETQTHLNNIMDTMSSAGPKFIDFLSTLRALDEDAANGDQDAERLIQTVIHFSKLINASHRRRKQHENS